VNLIEFWAKSMDGLYEVISSRNESLIERDGFTYCFDKLAALLPGYEYWRCVKKSPYCPARLTVSSDWEQNQNGRFKRGTFSPSEHNHAPDPEMKRVNKNCVNGYIYTSILKIREAKNALKNEAWSANPGPSRSVVDQTRSTLPLDARLQAPQKNMSMLYFRERVKADEELGDRGLDGVGQDFVIPNDLIQSVLINVIIPGEGRIVAFAAGWALQFLTAHPQQIAIDGTFAVSILSHFFNLLLLKSISL
jgi:hypothetical protein